MKILTADPISKQPRVDRYLVPMVIMITVLILIGLYAFRTPSKPGTVELPTISQKMLEDQYGLRVNLVAVTAAGGMVDLRIKIVDGEKAESFLQNRDNFPSLWIAGSATRLMAPEETRLQEILFENDGNLFVMFPNSRGIVKQGTAVTIRFGDTQVEPIPAR